MLNYGFLRGNTVTTIAIIFSIGAFIIACLAFYVSDKKHQAQKQPKPKQVKRKSKTTFAISPKFIAEAKSEREHRKKQREKYGMFDKNGNLKPEYKDKL